MCTFPIPHRTKVSRDETGRPVRTVAYFCPESVALFSDMESPVQEVPTQFVSFASVVRSLRFGCLDSSSNFPLARLGVLNT